MDVATAAQALLTPHGRADPYPLYDVLRGCAPVLTVSERSTVVTGYAEAGQILRDPAFQVTDASILDGGLPGWRAHAALDWLANSMLWHNPPGHERMRAVVSRAFTARRVAALRAEIERIADRLLDGPAWHREPVDFMAEFAYPLPVGVICALLGVPEADRAWFQPRASDLAMVLEPFTTDPAVLARGNLAADELRDYLIGHVAQRRRASGADDLVAALLAAGAADRLSGPELLANLGLLLIAGFETTTNLLGNGLAVLLDRPGRLARLRAEPARASAYVEEMLRFDAPVQLTSRFPAAPTELAGVPLPAGHTVLVLLGAANRDPARFPDPHRFDPDRPANQPLSFGAGPHFCLGAALARLEAQVAFPLLLRRFPAIAGAGEPLRRDQLAFRGYASLPVMATP